MTTTDELEIKPGQRWYSYYDDGSPWGPVSSPDDIVLVLKVKEGWVLYSFGHNSRAHCKEKIFRLSFRLCTPQ